MQAHRYAIYLAPAEPYRTFGSRWLGRDADTGGELALPDDMGPRPSRWVDAPAHYGLHATLKPPFRLGPDTTPAMLDAAARDFARGRPAFAAPLALRALRGFVAWCLAEPAAEGGRQMHALADDCVRGFDAFRAPASPAEVARRNPAALSPPQRRMLQAWGYPYVFETFTFHITLTGMLDAPDHEAALARLSASAGALTAVPLAVDAISLFVQPEPDAPFVAARHYGFDGGTRDAIGAEYLT